MGSQKYENMLNLALETEEATRQESKNLNVGFDEKSKIWQVIVRYSGDIESLRDYGVGITYLITNYAILDVPENIIEMLGGFREIIYVEMPKSIYLNVENGKRVSCINQVQNPYGNINLYGNGVICACIDSGIDIYNEAFLDENGNTRILELWDQNIEGNPPEGKNIGNVFSREDINNAIREFRTNGIRNFPSVDLSGHGTHVAGIMAGNFAANKQNNMGIATKSELLIVKLNTRINNGFPTTTEMMQAIDYVYRTAMKYSMPVAINISFGNSYGSHDGTSLISTFIDDISDLWKMSICIGTGNEGSSAGHFSGNYSENDFDDVEFVVGEYETNLNIQIWKTYEDDIEFTLFPPGDLVGMALNGRVGKNSFNYNNMTILVYAGEPSPYSTFQEIYFEMIPKEGYVQSGLWKIRLFAKRIINGRVDMWMPDSAVLNFDTEFLRPDANTTLTIPSTSNRAISVGGYNQKNFSYADFSGRGFTRVLKRVKPEIAAPAVDIVSAAVGGGVTAKSGTSMATPFVTGSAALLMEWGIIKGNDIYLYGEKLKAYLINGAKEITGTSGELFKIPNEETGYGALCLYESFPT